MKAFFMIMFMFFAIISFFGIVGTEDEDERKALTKTFIVSTLANVILYILD